MKKFFLSTVLALSAILGASAQNEQKVTVTGTVIDDSSIPVIGATVMVKGNISLGGAVTDMDGNFRFDLPKGATLEVSCIGYDTETRVINEACVLMITLKESTNQLSEVVVVGYGVQAKESVVGAIASIGSSSLTNAGTTDITNALAGKVPGLLSYSASGSGAPGENTESLMIRGLSSWNGSEPLVMVDGIERSMSELSPTDIESVSVLKDASATAVYGAKGANGVILVTTKTGKKGAPKFHVNAEYSMGSPVMLPEHIDAVTTATMANVAYQNQGSFASMYSAEALDAYRTGSNPLRYPDVDWYSLMMKSFAPGMNANMNLSGGTDRFKYYMGLSYVHEGSILKDLNEEGETNYKSDRLTYRLNLDFDITKTTKLSLKAGGTVKDVQGPKYSEAATAAVSSSIMVGYMYKASTIDYPAYYPAWALEAYPDPDYPDEQGERIAGNQGHTVQNPYARLTKVAYALNETNTNNVDLILNQNLDFITKGLSLSAKAGLTSQYSVMKENAFQTDPSWDISWESVDQGVSNPWIRSTSSNYVYYVKPFEVESDNSASSVAYTFYLEGAVNYKRKFNNKHNVTGLLLYNQRQYNSAASFPKKNQSFVGRVTYDYKGRYLFEANAGITGSEQFAPTNRYGFFPSVAVGYYLSKEKFFKKALPWWSTMKIRYSHGKVGSDNTTANWLYYTYWSKITYSGVTYYTEGAAPNENARWETAIKRDLGLEMGWLDDSILLNVDLYNEDREDILIAPIVTMFVANDYKDINAGAMKKHGIELDIKYRKIFANKMSMEVGGMLGLSENRITAYEELEYAPQYQKYVGTQYGAMRTGETLVDDGYFNSIDEIHGYPTYTSSWSGNVVPGIYKFLDYDHDGTITTDDLHAVEGSVYAPGTYSLNFSLGYKGFSLSVMGTGTIGKYLPVNGSAMVPFAQNELVAHKMQVNYWTPTNHDATSAVPLFSDLMYSWGGGSITDGSDGYSLGLVDYTWRKSDYFMLKEAKISYKFDLSRLRDTTINGLTVSVSANNLFLLSDIVDVNPTGTSGMAATYPQMRTVKLGLSVDF